jgi:hypothetical protein
MLRLVCDTAALRPNHDTAHDFCLLDLFSKPNLQFLNTRLIVFVKPSSTAMFY